MPELPDVEVYKRYLDVTALHRKIEMRSVLMRAVKARADPSAMPRSFLLPYREKGGRCPRCGGKLKRTAVGGRTSWYCPKRQER